MAEIDAFYLYEHAQNPLVLSSSQDVDALFDTLLTLTWVNRVAMLHPVSCAQADDVDFEPLVELMMAVDPERGVSSLKLVDSETGNWESRGPGEDAGESLRYCLAREPCEFGSASSISLDLARLAVKQFLANGGKRPTCIEWQPDEYV